MGQLVIDLTPEAEEKLGKVARARGEAMPEYARAMLEQVAAFSNEPKAAEAEREPEDLEEVRALTLAAFAKGSKEWADPQEKAAAFLTWVEQNKVSAPPIPEEATRREYLYRDAG